MKTMSAILGELHPRTVLRDGERSLTAEEILYYLSEAPDPAAYALLPVDGGHAIVECDAGGNVSRGVWYTGHAPEAPREEREVPSDAHAPPAVDAEALSATGGDA